MCVIIYVPKQSSISYDELKNAWTTNPDGAGYSIQKDGKVFFKRGFMEFGEFVDEVNPLIGKYNLLLHFRISTSKAVNKIQTHPYKKGNVTLTTGFTDKPVICMNGIITGQREYKNCNDTMSYIIDHKEAFDIVNQDILNIIEDATGAKWAVMKPNEVLLSSKFTYSEGKYYSNQNHLWRRYIRTWSYNNNTYNKRNFNNLIKGSKLKKAIRRDVNLYDDVMDFIDIWCRDGDVCDECSKCLKKAKTLRDVKNIISENLFIDIQSDKNEENSLCNVFDEWYTDIYDYNYNENLFDE